MSYTSEVMDLREEVASLKVELAAVKAERDEWRKSFYDLVDSILDSGKDGDGDA